jgi:predicted transcriptional regulator
MQILRTINEGNTSLNEILESNMLDRKKAKELIELLLSQGYLEQGYTDTGMRSETYELSKKGLRTLNQYLKVELLLLEHAPEILVNKV